MCYGSFSFDRYLWAFMGAGAMISVIAAKAMQRRESFGMRRGEMGADGETIVEIYG